MFIAVNVYSLFDKIEYSAVNPGKEVEEDSEAKYDVDVGMC